MTLREILPRILYSTQTTSGRRLLKDTPYTSKITRTTLSIQIRLEITSKTLPVYDEQLATRPKRNNYRSTDSPAPLSLQQWAQGLEDQILVLARRLLIDDLLKHAALLAECQDGSKPLLGHVLALIIVT